MFWNKCKYKLKIGTIYNIYYFFITRLWNTFYLEKKNTFIKHIYPNHNHRLTYPTYILSFNKLQKYWHSVCNFFFFSHSFEYKGSANAGISTWVKSSVSNSALWAPKCKTLRKEKYVFPNINRLLYNLIRSRKNIV